MAHNLIAVRTARPDAALIVYAGNLHTMRKPSERQPGYEWMAMRLARAGVAFVSLNPRYADGSAWNCRGPTAADCGPQLATGASYQRGIHLEPTADGKYDGWFGVGPITASPPAAFPALAENFDAQLAKLRDGPDARRAQALRAYNAKQYAQCAEEFGRIDPPGPGDAYNQACCLALSGNKEAAFERLRFAIDHGFTDLDSAKTDPDLASLHDDPRWPLAPKH
jgi:hypothetical protein